MARTPSNMLDLDTKAPDFSLLDTVKQQTLSYTQIQGKNGTVVMFICNHCPYVKHVFKGITDLANEYQNKGIGFVAISSNDVENYPDDSPELMQQTAIDQGFTFPYLYDETQNMAKVLQAQCTPEFYLYNGQGVLVYRGRLDDSSPGNDIKVSGKDLRDAINALLSGQSISEFQQPSMGCSIKWK